MLCFLGSLSVPAQEKIHFERIERENGGQLGHVFDIFEGPAGFMWFCTPTGLIKYDGFDFKFFQHDTEDSTSITNTWVYGGHVDSKGRMWIGSRGGLDLFDRRSETFQKVFPTADDEESVFDRRVRDINEDSHGRIWVGTFGGIYLYDEARRVLRKVDAPGFIGARYSANFFEDSKGRLWMTSETGLYKIDPSTMTARQSLPADVSAQGLETQSCIEGESGVLWVTTKSDLYIYILLRTIRTKEYIMSMA